MHSIEDLENHFGLSYNQVRDRVIRLQENFGSEFKGGNGTKYRVTDNGFKLFERLVTLEESSGGLKYALNTLKEEMKNGGSKRESDTQKLSKINQKYVKNLENQVSFLQEELKNKESEIERLHDKVDRLLPAAKEQEKPEATPWELFKNWLFKPR